MPVSKRIHPDLFVKNAIMSGSNDGAKSLTICSIRTITELTCVKSYAMSGVIGPTRMGTQSLSTDSLLAMLLRSWTTSRRRIKP